MIENKIKKNIALAPMTTFKIGGLAEYFLEADSLEDMLAGFVWAESKNIFCTILGGGSNVLINDKGIKGLVIRVKSSTSRIKGERIECGAGTPLSDALRKAAASGLTGFEWASGIPGTIGGAIRGNAGAFGFEISNAIETVEAINLKKRKIKVFSRKDCDFSYRSSRFKKNPEYFIYKAVFKLAHGNSDAIQADVEKYAKSRYASQPKLPSAGCVFKNLFWDEIKKDSPVLASQVEAAGLVKGGKFSAGYVVDLLGLKGRTVGGAKISLEHANFIVNTGQATAEDVAALISIVKTRARNRLKIKLSEEIEYLGFN